MDVLKVGLRWSVFDLLLARFNKHLILSVLMMLSFQVNAQVQFQNTTESIGGPFHTGESWGVSWGHMDNDIYPDLFVNNHAMKNSLLRNNGDGTFSDQVDVADLSGIMVTEPRADIHGGAWGDYDNDGDQDLFVTRSSKGSRLYAFENNGQGQFTERGNALGVNAVGGGRMPMLFDYDNDGILDLAVTGNQGNDLFKWNGNRFIDIGDSAGVTNTCRAGTSAIASDFFNTGSLIYLCSSSSKIIETAYDTNFGNLPFTDVSDKFDHIGSVPDVVLADFNNDLKMDMFALRGIIRPVGAQRISDNRIEAWISRGGTADYFASYSFSASGPITIDVYARNVNKNRRHNIHIGSSAYNPSSVPFTLSPSDADVWGSQYAPEYRAYGLHVEYDEVDELWTVTLSGGGSGSSEGAFIAVDGNGLSEPVIDGLIFMDSPVAPRFLLNNGNRLVNSNSRGIGNIMCGGIAAADFDNDMDIDLYLACRTSIENTENRLYLNNGSGTFTLASNTGGEGLLGAGIDSGAGTAEMAVTADYDIDGFVDLFVTNGNRLFPHVVQDGFSAGGPDQFYRNTTNNNNKWLEVDLEGVTSNRDGFGTKVIVTAGGVSQLREQNGQFHRWSQDHKRLHFGLAENNTADIRIEWPDGSIDNHNNVSVNKLYNAIQGGALIDKTPTGGGGTPVLSINDTSQVEGEAAELVVSLTSSGNQVSVDYETIAQSATSGIDYVAASGTLEFTSAQTSKTISISTLLDDQVEEDEVFTVVLSNPIGASISKTTGLVNIQDEGYFGGNCGMPTIDPSQSNDKGLYIWQDCVDLNKWSIEVNAGGGSWTVFDGMINSDEIIGSVVSNDFESGDDFELLNSDQQLSFFMGTANQGQDGLSFITIEDADLCLTLDDNLPIFYGANAIAVTSPVNLNNILALCVDNNSLPTISINNSIEQEGGVAELTVSLSSSSTSQVSVNYETVAQSATSGDDYSAQMGALTFSANEISQSISIPILEDNLIEEDESFTVLLSSPNGGSISQGVGIVTIEDTTLSGGDSCGEPEYNVNQLEDRGLYIWQDCTNESQWSIRVNSGGGDWTTFDGLVSSNLSISDVIADSFESSDSFQLMDNDRTLDFFMGTARFGEDGLNYTASADSDLCLIVESAVPIFYGVNSESVTSPVNLNDISDDCFDNSNIPVISVSDVSVSENLGVVDLVLNLSEASTNSVSVSYSTVDGSAVSGEDYIATSGVVSFAPGEITKTVTVIIVQDNITEAPEEFSFNLSNVVGATLSGNAVISITEIDNTTVCGMPNFSAPNDAGLFIWKDCSGSGKWSFRATAGGGASITYTGTVISDFPITSVDTFSFEGIDSYELTNGDEVLDFIVKMSASGQDGISFDLEQLSTSCFDVQSTQSTQVFIGSQNTVVNPPFELDSLNGC